MPQPNQFNIKRPYSTFSIDDIEKIARNHWDDKGFLLVINEDWYTEKHQKQKNYSEK